MKYSIRFTLLLLCLALLLTPSGSGSAQAGANWLPGFYTGWISFAARIDTNAKWPSLSGFVIEKFNGRGQLMVKINQQGSGGATIVLPVDIKILDYGSIESANGNCTFSSYAIAQTNYVRLRNEMTDVSTAFEVPISLSPGIRFNATNASSFGSLKGCDQAGAGNLRAMKTAMRVTTAEMKVLEFTVKSSDEQSVSGTCSIKGWEKTTPISNGEGQGVRSLPRCTWRVFKMIAPNQKAEWTQ
jgi:hypothetical protein